MSDAPSDDYGAQRTALLRWWYDEGYPSLAATADGSFFERYLHQSMERRYNARHQFERVLEVGGDRGQHVPYVRHHYREYVLTDLAIPEPNGRTGSDPRLVCEHADVHRLPYRTDEFDRVIATCVLHHVHDPLLALHEMRRVTNADGGMLSILLPTDPGLAYRFGKRLTTGRRADRRGWGDKYELLTALDHKNHFPAIRTLLSHVFRKDTVTLDWRPFHLSGWHLNAFVVVHVRKGVECLYPLESL